MSQTTETVKQSKLVMWPLQPIMLGWWENGSRSVYFASQGKTGVYILPHKINVTCEITLFVYVAWRKTWTVLSFSCSLKMFGWRQNRSRSGYFASWGKIDTAWVIQKYWYRHRISAMKIEKKSVSAQKNVSVELYYRYFAGSGGSPPQHDFKTMQTCLIGRRSCATYPSRICARSKQQPRFRCGGSPWGRLRSIRHRSSRNAPLCPCSSIRWNLRSRR